jgi:hypothetical protein
MRSINSLPKWAVPNSSTPADLTPISWIDLNVLANCVDLAAKRVFFASSACVYPQGNQTDRETVNCVEDTVYPGLDQDFW